MIRFLFILFFLSQSIQASSQSERPYPIERLYYKVETKNLELHIHTTVKFKLADFYVQGQVAFLNEYIEAKIKAKSLKKKKFIINVYSSEFAHRYLALAEGENNYYADITTVFGETRLDHFLSCINYFSSGNQWFQSPDYRRFSEEAIGNRIDSFTQKFGKNDLPGFKYTLWKKGGWSYVYEADRDLVNVYYNNSNEGLYGAAPEDIPYIFRKTFFFYWNNIIDVYEKGERVAIHKFDMLPRELNFSRSGDNLIVLSEKDSCLCSYSFEKKEFGKCP
jgi:hypothetical protein